MTRLLLLLAGGILAAAPLRFRVTLDASIAPNGASGRLIVLLAPGTEARETISAGFVPRNVSLAAKEIGHWAAGATVELDSDVLAYPGAFSKLPPGDYSAMALLDLDHSYARERMGPGDLTSAVVPLANLRPGEAEPVELRIMRKTDEAARPADTPNVHYVEMESRLLSRFWGRTITVRAGVVTPPAKPGVVERLPAVYHVHGFGGDLTQAWQVADTILEQISSGKRFRAVHVYLDANCPGGHHVFADSVNNGPWGQALTEEFIPYLEKRFRLAATPAGRFLTGHSSGGWSTLWLQVRYPDYFAGAWPTAPDAVDFRSFTGVDVTPGSTQNAYKDPKGQPLNLVRGIPNSEMTLEEFARMEVVTGDYGGQLASFEWVFSPRGEDGRPLPLFDRSTGRVDPRVQQAWTRYDIARILREDWARLGPKLRGKIRLAIGDQDNFHLNESAVLLCDWLKAKGREDACEIVPGRDHFTLMRPYKTYPDAMMQRIDDEMRAKWNARKRIAPAQPR